MEIFIHAECHKRCTLCTRCVLIHSSSRKSEQLIIELWNSQKKWQFSCVFDYYLFKLMHQGVYKDGGRKFVMLNLAPLGCLPILRALNLQKGVTNGSCMEEVTNMAKMFNSALPKMLKQLEKQLPGFKHTIFNTFKVSAETYDNPTKYGMFYRIEHKILYFSVRFM